MSSKVICDFCGNDDARHKLSICSWDGNDWENIDSCESCYAKVKLFLVMRVKK